MATDHPRKGTPPRASSNNNDPEQQARVIPLFPEADAPSAHHHYAPSGDPKTNTIPNNSLEMVPPTFLTGPTRILLFILALIFITNVLPKLFADGLTPPNITATVLLAALSLLTLAIRARRKPDAPQRIVLGTSHAIFPYSPHNKAFYTIPYEEIRAVLRLENQDDETILIDTPKRLFSFTAANFTSPHAPTLLWAGLLSKIRTLADGETRLRHINELAQNAYLTGHNRTIVTHLLLLAIAAGFLLQIATGALLSPFHMLDLGANNPELVANGQWFRLISSNFLHASWPHLLINGVSLLFLGTLVERLIGSRRMLLVYLLSAIAGAGASAFYAHGALSVGASTALFGLLGAFAVIHWKYRNHLPPPYRQTRRWWVIILSLNALLPLLIPQIDVAAHAGGFFAGVIATALLLIGAHNFNPGRKPSRKIHIACLLALSLCTTAFIQTAIYAMTDHPHDDIILVYEYIRRAQHDGPDALQILAQTTVFDPRATHHRLQLALQAAEKAQQIAPHRTDITHTITYLKARLSPANSPNPPPPIPSE